MILILNGFKVFHDLTHFHNFLIVLHFNETKLQVFESLNKFYINYNYCVIVYIFVNKSINAFNSNLFQVLAHFHSFENIICKLYLLKIANNWKKMNKI